MRKCRGEQRAEPRCGGGDTGTTKKKKIRKPKKGVSDGVCPFNSYLIEGKTEGGLPSPEVGLVVLFFKLFFKKIFASAWAFKHVQTHRPTMN